MDRFYTIFASLVYGCLKRTYAYPRRSEISPLVYLKDGIQLIIVF